MAQDCLPVREVQQVLREQGRIILCAIVQVITFSEISEQSHTEHQMWTWAGFLRRR